MACKYVIIKLPKTRYTFETLRFLVPLCVTDEQLEKGFEIFETALVKAKSDK